MRAILLVTLLALSSGVFADDFAEKLFEARCSNCHQLPEPTMLSAKQWKIVLSTMQQRMQHLEMVPLSDDEFKTIHGYLSAQSGR